MSTAIVTTTVQFTDEDGAAVAVTTATCRVQPPDSKSWAPVTPVNNTGTGAYSATYTCEMHGAYIVEWYGVTSTGLERWIRTTAEVK